MPVLDYAWARWCREPIVAADFEECDLEPLPIGVLPRRKVVILLHADKQVDQRSIERVRHATNHPNFEVVSGDHAIDPSADLVLLNEGIDIDQPEWLIRLQAAAHADRDTGIVGCRLRSPNGNLRHAGTISGRGDRPVHVLGQGELDVGQHPDRALVDGVDSACMLIKREAPDTVRNLNPRTIDWFRAVRRHGYKTICCGDVTLTLRDGGVDARRDKWIAVGSPSVASSERISLTWLSNGDPIPEPLLDSLERLGVDVKIGQYHDGGSFRSTDFQVFHGPIDAMSADARGNRIASTRFDETIPVEELLRIADGIIEFWVPSNRDRDCFRAAGVRKPIWVIPPGVDPAYFHPRIVRHRDPRVCLFLAEFDWNRQTALEQLLLAYTEEFEFTDDTILVVKATSHEENCNLREMMSQWRLRPKGGRVILSVNEDIPEHQRGVLYRSADCVVVPAGADEWGRNALAAMACGTPVIATTRCAVADVLDASVGYPVDDNTSSVEGFRTAMREVFENRDVARARGAAASQRVTANWTWEQTARAIQRRLSAIR